MGHLQRLLQRVFHERRQDERQDHRRRVFAEAREFQLYDFFTANGAVNEDVFAYSNRSGEERALVRVERAAEKSGRHIRRSDSDLRQR